MIHKLFRLKNDLFYNAGACIEEAEELHDKAKFAAAEYFLGKAAAYSYADELHAISGKKMAKSIIPWLGFSQIKRTLKTAWV